MKWLALTLLAALALPAQVPTHVFAPLAQWETAVRNGDAAALAAFYSTDPPPTLIASTGVYTDVKREASFWATWKKSHLTRLEVDMIADQAVNPDLRQVAFEAGIYYQGTAGPQTLFAFVQQTWLRQGGKWTIISGGRSDLSRLKQPTALTADIFPKSANASADIAAALQRAAADHKRVLLDFGGNWCYDCHVLDMAFRRSDLAPLLHANYELVNVDVEEFNYNLDIAQRYHLSIMKGVPMLAVLDSGGHVLASTQDGAFQAARSLSPDDLIRFLDTWSPGGSPAH